MGRIQQSLSKEIANDEIARLSSSRGSLFGLAMIVTGSFVLITYKDRYEGQDVFMTGSSCLSMTSMETPVHALSPFTFTQSNIFPENYDVSVRALKGHRLSMEDEYYIDNGGRFVAIFDGHGGGGVSTFLREKLYDKITKHLTAQNGDYESTNSEVDPTNPAVRSSPVILPSSSPISAVVNSMGITNLLTVKSILPIQLLDLLQSFCQAPPL